eukprot:CAMPEP_0172827122 /NCGR_PEP_ID=MMETSP1075-20121228/19910_1 /TAXON_ID=2916 /ORGANISM="Ceratium fusus, Strain PA161109" /LENGTH=77 /DNA_ID=CAMNT_0013668895 /DNA_START=68 /DNA_END=298 /DNA_ORIENTATION=+
MGCASSKSAKEETVQLQFEETEVRTGKSAFVPGPEALAMLKAGNKCYTGGQTPAATSKSRILALSNDGQLPMAAVLG